MKKTTKKQLEAIAKQIPEVQTTRSVGVYSTGAELLKSGETTDASGRRLVNNKTYRQVKQEICTINHLNGVIRAYNIGGLSEVDRYVSEMTRRHFAQKRLEELTELKRLQSEINKDESKEQ